MMTSQDMEEETMTSQDMEEEMMTCQDMDPAIAKSREVEMTWTCPDMNALIAKGIEISRALQETLHPLHASQAKPSLGPLHRWLQPSDNYKNDHRVLAFGFYGTLVWTGGVANKMKDIFDERTANFVFANWKHYQLEFMGRSNSMSKSSFVITWKLACIFLGVSDQR